MNLCTKMGGGGQFGPKKGQMFITLNIVSGLSEECLDGV